MIFLAACLFGFLTGVIAGTVAGIVGASLPLITAITLLTTVFAAAGFFDRAKQ